MRLPRYPRRTSGYTSHPASAWMRWLALACALFFAVVTTAQAAHLHRPAQDSAGQHLHAPGPGQPGSTGEEHCPLCVAIHPALPAPMHIAPSPVLVDVRPVGPISEGLAAAAWHFARFSRPPPVRA